MSILVGREVLGADLGAVLRVRVPPDDGVGSKTGMAPEGSLDCFLEGAVDPGLVVVAVAGEGHCRVAEREVDCCFGVGKGVGPGYAFDVFLDYACCVGAASVVGGDGLKLSVVSLSHVLG